MSSEYKIWHNRFDRLVELDLARGRMPEGVAKVAKAARQEASIINCPVRYYDAFMTSDVDQSKEYALKRRDVLDRMDEYNPMGKINFKL